VRIVWLTQLKPPAAESSKLLYQGELNAGSCASNAAPHSIKASFILIRIYFLKFKLIHFTFLFASKKVNLCRYKINPRISFLKILGAVDNSRLTN
jgi:hypothetical protein